MIQDHSISLQRHFHLLQQLHPLRRLKTLNHPNLQVRAPQHYHHHMRLFPCHQQFKGTSHHLLKQVHLKGKRLLLGLLSLHQLLQVHVYVVSFLFLGGVVQSSFSLILTFIPIHLLHFEQLQLQYLLTDHQKFHQSANQLNMDL